MLRPDSLLSLRYAAKRGLIISPPALTYHPLAHRFLIATLAALAALVSVHTAVSPDGYVLKLLYLLAAFSVALALTPQWFVAASVLCFAISTSIDTPLLASLPVEVYFSDLIVLLIAARGALPRNRIQANGALAGAPIILFALWAAVMAIAAARAMNAGVPFASAIRGDLALVYWPLLYFGFTRVLREHRLDVYLLWRNLAVVALGLAGWMFLARALNHPFEGAGLADVPTGDYTTVPRNFGFAAAFVVYPALALVGIAGMAHGGSRGLRWFVLASVGIVATLMTLVRGEILGLALGAVVILWLRPRRPSMSARMRSAVQLAFAVVAFAGGLIAANPTLGNAVIQRTLPFTKQAAGAKLNAEYREKAVETGFHVARAHPGGLGVLDTARLDAERIDPGYLAHSGVATLLLFGGWPALVTAVLTILALVRRSSLLPASTPWLHPAFVGVLTMLSVYTISAAGLAGDVWVIPLGALAVALRFTLQPFQERARATHRQPSFPAVDAVRA
jgi:O-Antigen ligase